MLTNEQLVAFAENAKDEGAKYWYGTVWYEASEALLARKARQYPAHYTSGRMATYRQHIAQGKMVCDCVGLIKGFFWTDGGRGANHYQSNNCPDTSANGMIALCDEVGAIATLPEQPGLVLWKRGHIGVYKGNGRAIEARGFNYGVVETAVSGRGWAKWGRLPASMISYGGAVVRVETPLLKRGMRGDTVEHMQALLVAWNQKALPDWGIDGDFGPETASWVRKFQRAKSLLVDGIVGPQTWGALLEGKGAIPA